MMLKLFDTYEMRNPLENPGTSEVTLAEVVKIYNEAVRVVPVEKPIPGFILLKWSDLRPTGY